MHIDLFGPQGVQTGDFAGYGKIEPGRMRPFMAEDGRTYIQTFRGGDPNKKSNYVVTPHFQTNADMTLRRDEWKALDEVLLGVARERITGIDDLTSRGLVYNLGNAMGTTVLEWHSQSDALSAVMTMDGLTRGENDRPTHKYHYLPIPIIHVDYELNARELAASRNMGNPLDTTNAENAARRIREKLEDLLFTNTTFSYGEKDSNTRNSIYSYLSFPDRNIMLTVDGDDFVNWTTSGKTGAQMVHDVNQMKAQSLAVHYYGPWILYIPSAYETVIDEDYSSNYPGVTIRDRILKIGGITDVKVVDRMPANNLVLVQMTANVVRLVRGMGLQNVMYTQEGGMISKYKVMTIQVPQIRSDNNGKTGIVHLS